MKNIWRYIEENDVSAHYGLATDEQLMKPYADGANAVHQATLRLYNYQDHCALVGRFQNINAELDLESCARQNIEFGRRQTGGGAIIMGRDQLGLCITCSTKSFPWTNVRDLCYLFSKPVIHALSKLGIEAEFRAKNDLEVGGKKIAGLGVYIDAQGAVQFHLSLLLRLDVLKMLSVLQIPIQKYSDKRKVNAVSQRMTTVSGEIGRIISQEEIRELICDSFNAHFNVDLYHSDISSNENVEIKRLITEKYTSEDWIYQKTPQADLTGMSLVKTPAGLLRIYIGLKGEVIKSVLITGDFIDHELIFKQIEAELKWSPLDKDHILRVVKDILNSSEDELSTLRSVDTGVTGDGEQRPVEHTLQNGYASNKRASAASDSGVKSGLRRQSTSQTITISAEILTNAIFQAAQKAFIADNHTYQGTCYYPNTKKEEKFNKPTV